MIPDGGDMWTGRKEGRYPHAKEDRTYMPLLLCSLLLNGMGLERE